MPQALRHTLLSMRDLLATAGPFILLALVLLAIAYKVLDPNPPKKVVLATGADQGAYAEFGKRYAKALAQHGIQVELRGTAGAAENLQLLRDPESGVDLAFVQGGADMEYASQADYEAANADLMSLGSLFYEPVWLFYREASAQRASGKPVLESFADMARPGDWKLNIGAPGSGVPNLVKRLLEANRVDAGALTLVQKPSTPAVVALLEGEIDALVFASAPESPLVQMLLQTPGIGLMHFAQAEAYARRFPFMSAVALPRGVIDLEHDLPPQDVHLIAPTGTLVAREGAHPALIQLFVQAAQEVHGGGGWLNEKGHFPNGRTTEQPLASEAERFYRVGIPVLQRYLPFWLANLIERMWPVLVALIAVLLPLSRILPPLYALRVRSRVFRWYGQLRTLEAGVGHRPADELERELAALEARVEHISVPLAYADELYALRLHIGLVRSRLQAGGPGG